MTTKRICDICGDDMSGYPRLEIKIFLRWSDVEILDVHAENECLNKVPQKIRDILYARRDSH